MSLRYEQNREARSGDEHKNSDKPRVLAHKNLAQRGFWFRVCRPVAIRNQSGGWNPKSFRSLSQSQSTNESLLIAAALEAMRISALSTLPFKQYRYARRNVSLAPRASPSFSRSNN